MNGMAFAAVLAGLGLLYMMINREGFVAEFTDRSNDERTEELSTSSYVQETNHLKMTKGPYEPPSGIETPFRVNGYNSYMPN